MTRYTAYCHECLRRLSNREQYEHLDTGHTIGNIPIREFTRIKKEASRKVKISQAQKPK